MDTTLREHLQGNYPLSQKEVDMLLDDICEYWNETAGEFIQSRHSQLQKTGMKNEDIYRLIQQEMVARRFAAKEMSIRQIRRNIYG